MGLMCCSVGVFLKPTEERKCIVDCKQELSNAGAPGFLFPHQGQRVYVVRGQKVTVDPKELLYVGVLEINSDLFFINNIHCLF